MYAWRKMSPPERRATLTTRKKSGAPWHSLPLIDSGPASYLLTATCYEHRPHIGRTKTRLDEFTASLNTTLKEAPSVDELIA